MCRQRDRHKQRWLGSSEARCQGASTSWQRSLGRCGFEQGSDTVMPGCWRRGWGSLLEAGPQGCNDLLHPPTSAPGPSAMAPVTPCLFILLPAAGLLAPGRGVLRPEPRERAACVSGPGRRGRCPMAWRLMPGRVPIHLISRGRFSAHLQLLWAEFPRFQPAPCPARPDALPPCQPPRSCPLCPWETWGVLGRLAGRAGGPWGLSVGRASWAQHLLWAHTTRGLSQLAVGARLPWKNTGSFLLRKGLAGGGWKEATLHAGGQGRGRQLWGAPRRLPCSRPWRLTEQASLWFGNQVLF